MNNIEKWLLVLVIQVFGIEVSAKPTLSCGADIGRISHSLEIDEKSGEVASFSYLSSAPSQSLALNCTIDSSLVSGAPTVSGGVVIYPLSGGDFLTIAKQRHGYLVDMSRLDAANYCGGIVAKKITVVVGRKRCKIQ